MYVRNMLAALVYRAVLFFLSIMSLLLVLGLSGGFYYAGLLYYPVISNLLCAVICLAECIVTAMNLEKEGTRGTANFAPHFKGSLVLMMLSNIPVYFYLLEEMPLLASGTGLGTVLLHFVLPILVLLDWLLWDKKGNFSADDPLTWMLIPFSYFGITLFAAFCGIQYPGGSHYPYTFLNPGTDGSYWGPVLVSIVLLAVGFLAVGYLLFAVDKILARLGRRATEIVLGAESGPMAQAAGPEMGGPVSG